MKYKKLLIFLMAASLLTNSGSYTVFASQADAAASVFESMEADAGLSAAESSESQAEENSESSGSSESAESSAEGESGSGEVVNPEDQSGESTAGDDSSSSESEGEGESSGTEDPESSSGTESGESGGSEVSDPANESGSEVPDPADKSGSEATVSSEIQQPDPENQESTAEGGIEQGTSLTDVLNPEEKKDPADIAETTPEEVEELQEEEHDLTPIWHEEWQGRGSEFELHPFRLIFPVYGRTEKQIFIYDREAEDEGYAVAKVEEGAYVRLIDGAIDAVEAYIEPENIASSEDAAADNAAEDLPEDGAAVSGEEAQEAGEDAAVSAEALEDAGDDAALEVSEDGAEAEDAASAEQAETDGAAAETGTTAEGDEAADDAEAVTDDAEAEETETAADDAEEPAPEEPEEEKEPVWVYIEAKDAAGEIVRGYANANHLRSVRSFDNDRSKVEVLRKQSENGAFYDNYMTTYRSLVDENPISSERIELVNFALQFLGNPYVWGGESLTDGCDCSGFAGGVYRHFGYDLPRCSYEMCYVSEPMNPYEALPGDLLFFAGAERVNHVMICLSNEGDGTLLVVEAKGEKWGIVVSRVSCERVVWGISILGQKPEDKEEVFTAKEHTMLRPKAVIM